MSAQQTRELRAHFLSLTPRERTEFLHELAQKGVS